MTTAQATREAATAPALAELRHYRLWLRAYMIGALMNDDPALRERIESLRDDLTLEGE